MTAVDMAHTTTHNHHLVKRFKSNDYDGGASQPCVIAAGASSCNTQLLPESPLSLQPQAFYQPPPPGYILEISDEVALANCNSKTAPLGEDCLLLPFPFPSHISTPAFMLLSCLPVKLRTFMRRYAPTSDSQQTLPHRGSEPTWGHVVAETRGDDPEQNPNPVTLMSPEPLARYQTL
jgi:hypothetical protein